MHEISYAAIMRRKRVQRAKFALLISISAALMTLVIKAGMHTPSRTPNKSNTLSISGPWEITSLDPSKQGYILSRMQVTETLLNVNLQGELTAGLATHWHNSDDGLRWRFILRKGVRFHDGEELNAQAVVNSLKQAYRKHGSLRRANILSIEALSDDELEIVLSTPHSAFAALLTNYANAILSPASYATRGRIMALYGTGPYQVEHFSPPHKLLVARVDDYWGDVGKIAFAQYLTGHRAESRLLQAKAGEADIVFSLDPSMLDQLDDAQNLTVHSSLVPRSMVIKLNASHPFLRDIKARRALSLALDRDGIANNVLNSPGAQSGQLFPPSLAQWHLSELDAPQQQLAQAAHLLSELGWQKNAQGHLVRQGEAFNLNMMTYADRPELTTVATAIQAQWAKLGVHLTVSVVNSSAIPAGHHDNTLETALIARNFGVIADPLPIISSDFRHGGGDWGAMNWHHDALDKHLEVLVSQPNNTARHAHRQAVAHILQQELPMLPVVNYSQHTAVNTRVKHFRFDPFERDYFINQMELR